MIDRRDFAHAVGFGLLGTSLRARAQPVRLWRIGLIVPRPSSGDPSRAAGIAAFHGGMRERGYVEGRDYRLEEHSVDGRNERYAEIANALVASRVDLLLVPGTSAALAAQKATATIPVVFVSVSDPVGSVLVASLSRPGGNITGRSTITAELDPKRLELLRNVRPGGLIVFDQAVVLRESERVLHAAAAERVPAIYQSSGWVRGGGLMSYGPNNTDEMRRITAFVDKIMMGAKPSDLPVEEPTQIELVINLKAAKALGITIPQSLLLRADMVIR